MATAAALSPTLRSRIEQVADRIRMMRVVRGVSFLVLVLAVTGGMALLADYVIELPGLVRVFLFIGWFGLGAACFMGGLVTPLRQRLEPAALAALIEEKYPDLGERLTTSVELSQNQDIFHGSPQLITLLLRETERRTYQLPFVSAVPVRYAALLAGVAAMVLAVVAAPFVVAPQEYSRLTRRFLLAYIPMVEPAPYRIDVTPGDIVTAQGKTVKVSVRLTSVRLTPRKAKVKLPQTSSLVLTDAEGKQTSQRMVADSDDAFSTELKVAGSGKYRIETGDVASGTYTVTSVVPVELAPESPRVVVELPEYARATIETPEPAYGLDDLTVLQHGQVTFAFRFTRPAVNAFVEWTPGVRNEVGGMKLKAAAQTLPLALSEDRQSATWTLPAKTSGSYGLVLEAEHAIRTTLPAHMITVQEDKEPQFFKFTGKEELRTVLPYDTVPIDVEVGDDIAVDRVAVEYRVNGRDPVAEEIPVEVRRDVRAKYALKLAGKVIEGDEVGYRIRVQDNLPKEYGGPHTVYYPPDRWLQLRVVKQTSSLNEQDILAQRNDIEDRLERIKKDLQREQRRIYKVHEESKKDAVLNAEHVQEVKQLRSENKAIESAMMELVRDMAATPALGPLVDRVEDVANTEMRQSQEALDKVDPKKPALERNQKLENADHNVDQALKRLEQLRKLNDRLAQDRIDQNKLEMLAEREKKLAEQAAELAAKDPVRDPKAREQADQIKKEQAEVAAELQRLTEQSEKLRNALQEDAAEQARKAAERAKELAEAQRELTKAATEAEQKRNAEKLDVLATKQQDLADKAQQLANQTQQPAKAASTDPLKPEDARQAAEDLKKGNPAEALQHQDKTAQDLDRLANALDKAIDVAKNPREAARQLARLEEGLKKKVEEEAKRADAKQPLTERLKPLEAEQKAIQQAAEQLSVPTQNQNAQKEKQEATSQAEQAAQSLQKNDTKQATAKLDQAQKALERLADQLPTLDQRRQQAQKELERLRQMQDEVATASEQAVNQARQNKNPKQAQDELDRRLTEAARREAEIAERLSKMDVPNQEARQEKTREAMDRALADLMDARTSDIPATQQQARRELERLQQALAGQKPADEKARELAKDQRELAAQVAKAPPERAAELQRKQQQIAKETRELAAPEAPQRHAEATEATKKAEEAANAKPTSPDAIQSMQEAARKLGELAKQLEGAESDAARAERLAKRQAEAAADAERLAKKSPNQPPTPEEQKLQKQIAEEAKEVRAGDEAKAEKEKALQTLHRAEDANPKDQAKAQREAADALRDLADKLNGRDDKGRTDAQHTAAKPKDQTPQQAAREMAQQQRDLAKTTQKAQEDAAKQGGEAGKQALDKALQKLADQQKDLNQRASQLPARQNERNLEQARAAMNQAKQALERQDADQAKAKQNEAAKALDQLAQALPNEQPRTARTNPDAGAKPDLPTKEQAAQARDLAKEQRDLRDAVRRAQDANTRNTPRDNPLGDLARQQAEVARQAAELAKNVGQEQGEKSPTAQQAQQAQLSAKQTANQIEAGNVEKALPSGKQSADQLRKLAQDLAQTPRGKDADPESPEPVKQSRDLAKQQEEINQKLEALKDNSDAQRTQQAARQDNLRQETNDLANKLDQIARQMQRSPQAQQSASQARQSSKDAESAQQAAQQSSKQGDPSASQKAGNQAADALEKAAQQAGQAAREQQAAQQQANAGQPNGQDAKSSQQTGKAVNQAKDEVGKAKGQLNQGQNQGAKASMEKAADALAKAAEQMNQQGKPGNPTGQPGQPNQAQRPDKGIQAGGTPDASMFGPGMQKYAGKSWGELPGELRTKIVQDMKDKYGEDYARMIKLYFEQIASTYRPTNRPLPPASAPPGN
jgi:hypothetical protein